MNRERSRESSRIGRRMDSESKVNKAGRDIRVANRTTKRSQNSVIELTDVARLRFEVNRVTRICRSILCRLKNSLTCPLENISRGDKGFYLSEKRSYRVCALCQPIAFVILSPRSVHSRKIRATREKRVEIYAGKETGALRNKIL